jgi:hypothetical protein
VFARRPLRSSRGIAVRSHVRRSSDAPHVVRAWGCVAAHGGARLRTGVCVVALIVLGSTQRGTSTNDYLSVVVPLAAMLHRSFKNEQRHSAGSKSFRYSQQKRPFTVAAVTVLSRGYDHHIATWHHHMRSHWPHEPHRWLHGMAHHITLAAR